jgi:ABC-2 type transport system permease protein
MLLHILKYKLYTFLKPESSFKTSYILKNIGSALVYLLFAYATYLFTENTIKYLLEEVKIGTFLLHRFIFVVLFIFFIAVNIGNIIVSYSTLFRIKEIHFLISKPVSFTKIFLIKFLDNFFYSSVTLLLIITAVMLGYADYFNLPWYFIIASLFLMILPFMFIAGSLGSIILLLILKLSAKFGVKQVISLAAILYGTAIILFYYFSNPIHFVNNVFQYFPNINSYFGFLESPVIKILPNYWISEALFWISSGNVIASLWFIYLLLITSLLIFLLSLFIAKKWYYQSWLISLDLEAELQVKKNKREKFSFVNSSSLNPFTESIFKREYFLFFRETSQWAHLAVMLFLIAVLVLSIGSIDAKVLNAYNVYLKTLFYLIIFTFNVFLIASLALRFVFPLVSLEGEALWKIRSAPINFKKLLLRRGLIYFTVIFLIGQILSFVSNYQFTLNLILISQLNSALSAVTLTSLNFGMGSIFANYKEKNPIRLASSQGASITLLFSIVYLVVLVALLFTPLTIYFNSAQGGAASYSMLIYSSLIIAVIAAAVSLIMINSGVKRFLKDV